MHKLSFNKTHMSRDNSYISINSCFDGDKFELTSEVTGAKKIFTLDREATTELCMVNEGWDGEQYVNIFKNGNIEVHLWHTPYD